MTFHTVTFRKRRERRTFFAWNGRAESATDAVRAATEDLGTAWACLAFARGVDAALPGDVLDRIPSVRQTPRQGTDVTAVSPRWTAGKAMTDAFGPHPGKTGRSRGIKTRCKTAMTALARHAASRIDGADLYLRVGHGESKMSVVSLGKPREDDAFVTNVTLERPVASALLALRMIHVGLDGAEAAATATETIARPRSATLAAAAKAGDAIWLHAKALALFDEAGLADLARRLRDLGPA